MVLCWFNLYRTDERYSGRGEPSGKNKTHSGGVGLFEDVARTGFEPVSPP